jgi:hypothetical protein
MYDENPFMHQSRTAGHCRTLPDTAVNGGKHGVISAYNQPL